MQEYEKLKSLLEDCAKDVERFDSGNRAAGTRVRKAMQAVKEQAQVIRKAILEQRTG